MEFQSTETWSFSPRQPSKHGVSVHGNMEFQPTAAFKHGVSVHGNMEFQPTAALKHGVSVHGSPQNMEFQPTAALKTWSFSPRHIKLHLKKREKTAKHGVSVHGNMEFQPTAHNKKYQ